MGFGTKLQHALKFLPSLFDSDIGNRDEPQFQLLRHNDFTTGQVRRAISSNIAINTALPSTLHVAKSDVFLPIVLGMNVIGIEVLVQKGRTSKRSVPTPFPIKLEKSSCEPPK